MHALLHIGLGLIIGDLNITRERAQNRKLSIAGLCGDVIQVTCKQEAQGHRSSASIKAMPYNR